MLLWIIISGLALGVAGLLGLTLMRGHVGDLPPAAYDLQVYRDQLREVDRDLARGIIAAGDAERVKTEVSRRILAADTQLQAAGTSGGQPRGAGVIMAAISVLLLVAGSIWLYSRIGVPGLEDMPQAKRIAASEAARMSRLSQAEAEAQAPAPLSNPQVAEEFLNLMRQLRKTVEARPDDLQGLTLLVRNEAALGNLTAAHEAQAQIIRVKGTKAKAADYALLADLMVTSANGYVSADAERALRAALERDPRQSTARYYLGLYLLQVGRPDGAFRTWEPLLRENQGDAPWVGPIRAQLEDIAWFAGVEYSLPPLDTQSGPSAEDVEAAQSLTDESRDEMIRGMVTRLSERLSTQGGSAAEWARLIGAYGVLGEVEKAQAIWQEAQQLFTEHPEALAEIRAAANDAGVAE